MSNEGETTSTRRLYTLQEDLKIINFIVQNQGFNRVKGVALWGKLEKVLEEQGSKRSWQSLKERFRKVIIRNINLYDLDEETKAKLLAPYSEEEVIKPGPKEKGQKLPYSRGEDEAIARFVLSDPEKCVKGNLIWRNLEKAGILKDRSWMSMKNRFFNHVVECAEDVVNAQEAADLKRIANGDLTFVDYGPNDEQEPRKTRQRKTRRAAGKKRKLLPHFTGDNFEPTNDPSLPSTSRGRPSTHKRYRTFAPKTSVLESESDDSPPPTRKSRPRILSESEEELSDTQCSPSILREVNGTAPTSNNSSICEDVTIKPSASTSEDVDENVSKVPVLLLERCDDDAKTESSDSTIFNASTVEVNTQCSCGDCDLTRHDVPDAEPACSSACRKLVGPPVPLNVMTADALLRANRQPEDDEWVLQFTLSTESVEAPGGPQCNQSPHKDSPPARHCHEATLASAPPTTVATGAVCIPQFAPDSLGERESCQSPPSACQHHEDSPPPPECHEATVASAELPTAVSHLNSESVEVKSDRGTVDEDCRSGRILKEDDTIFSASSGEDLTGVEEDSSETPVQDMIEYLSDLDDDYEPDTFVDPLNRVSNDNIIVVNGCHMSLGLPKFPVL